MRNILILGYGSLGREFYRLFRDRYEIRGIRRSVRPEESCPIFPMAIQSESLRPHLEWADAVVFCPSSGGGDLENYRDTYFGNMRFVVRMIQENRIGIRTLILVGSTGVYPRDREGVWKEDSDIPKETPRQEILLSTEDILIRSGLPFIILRCGGLYGENRGGFTRIAGKKEIPSSDLSDQFIALVHEGDVCRVIDRAIETGRTGEIYNVVDDSGLRRKDLYRMISERAGIPLVETGPAAPASERRIDNAKIKKTLGYSFRHAVTTDSIINYLAPSARPREIA